MTSILDMKPGPPDYWADIYNFFLPLKYLITNERLDALMQQMDLNYLMNAMFWIFLFFAAGFMLFYKISEVFLKLSNVKFYNRKQFARTIWNVSFYAACTLFLYFYNEFMLLPQLSKNQGRYSLFYSSENMIFYRSQQCEKFQFYSLFIITFYLHSAILDFKESDYLEAGSKTLYLLALVALDFFKSHVFISLLPFKYLVPTLFAKNFKLTLNVIIWLWYGISIWNSPVLQYFYHQIYHSSPMDCSGEGSAAKCILLKDSSEHRHFKTLKKAYMEVKLAHEKLKVSTLTSPSGSESSFTSAKAFQAIKCIMTLKRKLKRIREGRGSEIENDAEDMANE
ncbi:uncharacterized protein [Eurosta solidaginis]|uniref:uncharacterized protein isoform X2 n=1 Tax=Eurosta solidaginis TaxID=178769 RepID=UPI0035314484